MINFRYHVVTLVAVFLALGLGVLFGASFIDQKTVAGLQRSQERLGERNNALRQEILALQRNQEALQSFAVSSRDLLIRGALTGRAVVVVAFASTDDGLVRGTEDTLVKAGGSLVGSIRLSDDLEARSDAERRSVAEALQLPNGGDGLTASVVQNLSDALSGRERGYIQKLIDAGLASAAQPSGSQPQPPSELADAGTVVVLLPPAARDQAHRALLLPLIRSLANVSVPVAFAQGERAPAALIVSMRKENDLRAVTVDQADQPGGQAALALGLQAALAGNFGHYGTKEGATALLPAPQSLGPA